MNKKDLYFKKDKKAMIYKEGKSYVDEYGDTVNDGYRAIAPSDLWCYRRQLSQEQKFIAQSMSVDEKRFFVFNYRNDVEVYDLLKYKNELFQVTRVDSPYDYNRELFVYVREVPRGLANEKLYPYEAPDEEIKIEYDEDGFPIQK